MVLRQTYPYGESLANTFTLSNPNIASAREATIVGESSVHNPKIGGMITARVQVIEYSLGNAQELAGLHETRLKWIYVSHFRNPSSDPKDTPRADRRTKELRRWHAALASAWCSHISSIGDVTSSDIYNYIILIRSVRRYILVSCRVGRLVWGFRF